MDLYDYENDTLLEQAQHEIVVHLLPVILFLAISAFIGILGNVLTIIFYASKYKRSPFTMQIAYLATVDLLVSCMIIPHVIETIVNVRHNQKFLCKLTKFFGMWTISSSCLMLWMIALNRHRRICKPFAKQMNVKATTYCFVGIVVFSFFLSVRNFANFDINRVNVSVPGSNSTVRGLYCTTRDDSGYKISVYLFHIIDFLLLLMVLATTIVCYSRIICALFNLNRSNKRECPSVRIDPNPCVRKVGEPEDSEAITEMHDRCNKYNTPGSETFDCNHLEETHTETDLESSSSRPTVTDLCRFQFVSTVSDGIANNHQNTSGITVTGIQKMTQSDNMPARSPSERNLTFMMFAVSFLFILCFFPYFVVKIIMRLVLKYGEEFELSVGIQFALRLVYFNSVFNPIIYCFFNPQFRRYIKNMFFNCFRC